MADTADTATTADDAAIDTAAAAAPSTTDQAACTFCSSTGHAHTQSRPCVEFTAAKRAVTKAAYAAAELRPNDAAGFAAAGVLPWRFGAGGVEVLMASEFRHGVTLLNFLGGKRDAMYETPRTTASREVAEETLGLLHVDLAAVRFMVWDAPAKYAIFVPRHPIDSALAETFIARWAAAETRPNDAGLRGFAWVPATALLRREIVATALHAYMRAAIAALRRHKVIAWLQKRRPPRTGVARQAPPDASQ